LRVAGGATGVTGDDEQAQAAKTIEPRPPRRRRTLRAPTADATIAAPRRTAHHSVQPTRRPGRQLAPDVDHPAPGRTGRHLTGCRPKRPLVLLCGAGATAPKATPLRTTRAAWADPRCLPARRW